MDFEKFLVSDKQKTGTGEELFEFFAKCVEDVIIKHRISTTEPIPLGFTFSFPLNQTDIDKGVLMRWTKGFSASGVEGNDVVAMLQRAFVTKNLNVIIKAVVNDTVGTLISHAYIKPETQVAVILGTGTNAAYVEKAINVPKWTSDSGYIIINCEWGAFGDSGGLPMSRYDKILDEASANPGMQRFEKMISGMYLGELLRIVLVGLVEANHLFTMGANQLFVKEVLTTADLSAIEE